MSKYLEGMSEYDKGFVDGNRAKKALQAELKSEIEREARISELKRMWDKNTNLCVLDKDDTVATLTLKLGKTNQIIAKRIKELESE